MGRSDKLEDSRIGLGRMNIGTLWRVIEIIENNVGHLERRTGTTEERENTGFAADSLYFPTLSMLNPTLVSSPIKQSQ